MTTIPGDRAPDAAALLAENARLRQELNAIRYDRANGWDHFALKTETDEAQAAALEAQAEAKRLRQERDEAREERDAWKDAEERKEAYGGMARRNDRLYAEVKELRAAVDRLNTELAEARTEVELMTAWKDLALMRGGRDGYITPDSTRCTRCHSVIDGRGVFVTDEGPLCYDCKFVERRHP